MNVSRKDIFRQIKNITDTSSLAVLATERCGLPHTSLTGYLLSKDFKCLYFFTPKNTKKYKNIEFNPNVSIIIDNRDTKIDKKSSINAVTIIGKASIIEKPTKNLIYKFLIKNPELEEFTKPDLNVLLKVKINQYILVSKFQQTTELIP